MRVRRRADETSVSKVVLASPLLFPLWRAQLSRIGQILRKDERCVPAPRKVNLAKWGEPWLVVAGQLGRAVWSAVSAALRGALASTWRRSTRQA